MTMKNIYFLFLFVTGLTFSSENENPSTPTLRQVTQDLRVLQLAQERVPFRVLCERPKAVKTVPMKSVTRVSCGYCKKGISASDKNQAKVILHVRGCLDKEKLLRQ